MEMISDRCATDRRTYRRPAKMLFACIALVLFSTLGISVTQALTISPISFEETLRQGEIFTAIVKVTNESTTEQISLRPLVADFYLNEKGEMTFIDEGEPGRESYSLKDWMNIETEIFSLAPSETKEITFTITVPQNAEPGGHYGVVFFETIPETGDVNQPQLSIAGRVGALVLVTVPGQLSQSGEASDFQVGEVKNNAFTPKSFFEKGPAIFQFMFKNTGNSHYKPTGQIQVKSSTGKEVALLDIEDNRAFPGSPRAYQSTFNPPGFFGKYTATLAVNDGNGKELPIMTTSFTVFPTTLVVTWGIGIIVLILILIPLVKRYNRWVVEKTKK